MATVPKRVCSSLGEEISVVKVYRVPPNILQYIYLKRFVTINEQAVPYLGNRRNGIMNVSSYMKHGKSWQKIKRTPSNLLFLSMLPDALNSWFTGSKSTFHMLKQFLKREIYSYFY